MLRTGLVALVLALGLSLPTALAREHQLEDVETTIAGAYRFVGGSRQREAVERAIEEVVQEMNFLIRGIARRRMLEANRIPDRIDIAVDASVVKVDLPGKRPIAGPAEGSEFHWRDEYGEDVRVRQWLNGHRLVQHFQGEQGSRAIEYRLGADEATMSFHVTIRSPHLPIPLRYVLTYRRP